MNPHRLAICGSRLTAVNSLPREPCSLAPRRVRARSPESCRARRASLRDTPRASDECERSGLPSARDGEEHAVLPNVGGLMFRIKLCDRVTAIPAAGS
jgi:hypothetical protein